MSYGLVLPQVRENVALKRGLPTVSTAFEQRVRFAGESPDQKPQDKEPQDKALDKPVKSPEKPGAVKRSLQFMKKLVRKFTSYSEFKKSVAQGYQDGKDDLKKSLKSGSTLKAAGRLGVETVGLAVGILFLPMPGPNPAWFISPTSRAFFKGFIRDPKEEAENKSEAENKPPEPSGEPPEAKENALPGTPADKPAQMDSEKKAS